MIVAELEIFLSRPIAPTRRIALGLDQRLPVDPAPGFGGILLAGVAARFAPALDNDAIDEVGVLVRELEAGRRVPQPRLRHRLQRDRVGLQRCSHRLVSRNDELTFEFDEYRGTPAQFVLAALYAAANLETAGQAVLSSCRSALGWNAPVDHRFIAWVLGGRAASAYGAQGVGDPIGWAHRVLDLCPTDGLASRRDVQRAFRHGLRGAHPDVGGRDSDAARRIAELTEARRILLGV